MPQEGSSVFSLFSLIKLHLASLPLAISYSRVAVSSVFCAQNIFFSAQTRGAPLNGFPNTYAVITIFILMVRKVSVCQIYKGWWYEIYYVLHINQSGIIPSNICGCQSSTSATGQEKIRRSSINTKLQREHENKNKTKNKGTITQSTCQKTIEEGQCKEKQRSACHIMVTARYSYLFSSKLPK